MKKKHSCEKFAQPPEKIGFWEEKKNPKSCKKTLMCSKTLLVLVFFFLFLIIRVFFLSKTWKVHGVIKIYKIYFVFKVFLFHIFFLTNLFSIFSVDNPKIIFYPLSPRKVAFMHYKNYFGCLKMIKHNFWSVDL